MIRTICMTCMIRMMCTFHMIRMMRTICTIHTIRMMRDSHTALFRGRLLSLMMNTSGILQRPL